MDQYGGTDRTGATEAVASHPVDGLPRLRLDELLEELVGRAGELMAARDALRRLLAANRTIMGELSLPGVLRAVVEAACDLAGARYAALGVIGTDGNLEEFVHTGLTPDQVAAIGEPPRGRGLLGTLISDPSPIRLPDIAADPRSVGFPANHPPMRSFLGVPIRLREAVYGNLYLTDAREFTDEDTELVIALASTAAIAIENARLFQEAQRRQQWLQASTDITRNLLTGPADGAMVAIADQVREMADADVVTVVLPTGPDRLIVAAVSGQGEQELEGLTYARANTLSELAIESGEPIRLGHSGDVGLPVVRLSDIVKVGPVMAVPLVGSKGTRGALVVGRLEGRAPFSVAELDMASTFAGHAAVALELADARSTTERLLLLEDRDRIARDLHDHVIQRLFGAGLAVQSATAMSPEPSRSKLSHVVEDIDDTIRQIRTTIFELQAPHSPTTSLRTRLLGVVDDLSDSLGTSPDVRFAGPVDTVVPEDAVDDLEAVLRESLVNIAKHAQAHHVSIGLSATGGWLILQVTDDGVGVGKVTRRSGLANLGKRADSHRGQFSVAAVEPTGTRVTWGVPLN